MTDGIGAVWPSGNAVPTRLHPAGLTIEWDVFGDSPDNLFGVALSDLDVLLAGAMCLWGTLLFNSPYHKVRSMEVSS